MSNIIINKDRWQPKPKYQKVKPNLSKKFHSEKDILINEGYSEEECNKILEKRASESQKNQLLKKEIEVQKYINNKLHILNIEQQNKLLKILIKDYKNSKISKIKQHIDKLTISIKKDEAHIKSKLFNEKNKKDYKKKEFNTVKDLRKGTYKIKKK